MHSGPHALCASLPSCCTWLVGKRVSAALQLGLFYATCFKVWGGSSAKLAREWPAVTFQAADAQPCCWQRAGSSDMKQPQPLNLTGAVG